MPLPAISNNASDSLILPYLLRAPLFTCLGIFTVCSLVWICNRNTFAPLPLIGHLHIFLSRPRWGHLDWFLAASMNHLKVSQSGKLAEDREKNSGGIMSTTGLSWSFKIPGTADSVFTSDPACIKYVLVTKATEFSKTGLFADLTKDLFGEGFLVIQGHRWRMQRQAGKFLTLPSTLAHVHDSILPRCLAPLLAQLDSVAAKGEIVDIQRWAKDLTLAVFGVMAFDAEPQTVLSGLAQPLDTALSSVADRFGNPLWPLTEHFTAAGRRFRRDVGEVKRVSTELVQAVLDGKADVQIGGEDGSASGDEARPTLVELLLEAGVEDLKEITDSCINYTVAARDTTAHAFTWTIYQLLENPSILADLRSSIDSTPLALPPCTDTLSIHSSLSAHFSFLSDIFNESLRLHPPIPTEITQHTGTEPLCLPSGQIVIPGGFVTWSPWVMARLPALWGPSAAEFDPGRWARMREMGVKKNAFELPTFHAGPRKCVGKEMAKVVLLRTMEAVIRRYEIQGVGERKGRLGVGFTGEMEGGLKVRLKLRKGVV